MTDKSNNSENSINLQSFDLGEPGGGNQLIIDSRVISDTEYYVITLGNPPKINVTPGCNIKELEEKYLKNKIAPTEDANNLKLRFFKLTLQENNNFLVEEYVTLEGISEISKFFV